MKKMRRLRNAKRCCMRSCAARSIRLCGRRNLQLLLQIPAGKREELHKTLDMLLEEGKISINKRGRYEAVRKESGKKEKEPSREYEKKNKAKREFYLTGTFVGNARDSALWRWKVKTRIFLSPRNTPVMRSTRIPYR